MIVPPAGTSPALPKTVSLETTACTFKLSELSAVGPSRLTDPVPTLVIVHEYWTLLGAINFALNEEMTRSEILVGLGGTTTFSCAAASVQMHKAAPSANNLSATMDFSFMGSFLLGLF